jgi:hypothetical protein
MISPVFEDDVNRWQMASFQNSVAFGGSRSSSPVADWLQWETIGEQRQSRKALNSAVASWRWCRAKTCVWTKTGPAAKTRKTSPPFFSGGWGPKKDGLLGQRADPRWYSVRVLEKSVPYRTEELENRFPPGNPVEYALG